MVRLTHHQAVINRIADIFIGSRGPAVLDDFTASYGYRFFDNAGYFFRSSPYTCTNPSCPLPHIPTLDLYDQYYQVHGGDAAKLPAALAADNRSPTALEGPQNHEGFKYQSPDSLYN